MMHDMMSSMGWGMDLAGLLAIVALVKYVFFRST